MSPFSVLSPTTMLRSIPIYILLFLCIPSVGTAQLNVTSAKQSGNWADYYVQDVLLGSGVIAFNATFTGCDTSFFGHQVGYDSTQIGEYPSDSTIVDIPYGLWMASGSVEERTSSSINPNPGPGGSDGVGDADLQLLIPGYSLNNAAILEFDFVPQGDTIRFSYVFASMEYPNYVCSNFNDVFGFFLSGPGISGPYSNGAENLAIIPGTGTEVSINSVNDIAGGSNCSPPCPCNSQYFANNYTAPTDTNVLYGGMTVTLEAVSEVVCGDTYHIKMAIADAGDGILDSGVFLEGGSFSSNLIEVSIASVNGDSTINEGCGFAEIQFVRDDTADSAFTIINYVGTATNGVDFTELPDTIILPPGVSDTIITIIPFADTLNEGMEFITIQAISVTACGDTFISEGTLYFFDVPNLTGNLTPDTAFDCPPDSINLYAIITGGGPPPYTYLWSTGDTIDNFWVTLSPNGGVDTFVVEIQDSCALSTFYDTVFVTKNYLDDPVVAIINDSSVNCAGDQIILALNQLFGTPPFTYAWSDGSSDVTDTVTVNDPMTVFVTVTDACGREVVDTAKLTIKDPETFTVAFPDTTIFCIGSALTIDPVFSGGVGPYTYSWDKINPVFDDDSIITVTILGDTTIHFWVRDDCGRRYDTSFFIRALQIPQLAATLDGAEAQCAGAEFELIPDVTGGLEPIQYEWSTGDSNSFVLFTASTTQLVSLSVTDFCGNRDSTTALISIPDYGDIDLLISNDVSVCYGDEYTFEIIANGGAGGFRYEWQPINEPLPSETFIKLNENRYKVISKQSNNHYLLVTDTCGNTASDTVSITVDHCVFIPNVISPNGDGINDAFYINNITNFEDPYLVIYNRWGQRVFESKPYKNEWVPLNHSSGTYFYILRSENFPELRGTLTLVNDKKR